MKTLTILALLICQQASSQISISTGLNRWSESEINLQSHFLEPFNGFLKYAQTRINFGFSNQIDRHLFTTEASFFRKKNIVYSTSVSSVSGGGSSPVFRYSKSYYSQVSYAYLGLKQGYAFTFKGSSAFNKKWQTLIELGGFVGLDALTAYSEQGHYTHERSSNNSNPSQEMVVTLDVQSYDEFKAVSMRKFIPYAGLYVARRLSIKNVFIRGALSYGILGRGGANYVRVTPLNSSFSENNSQTTPDPEKRRFFSCDISVGYTFKRKEKEK